jgi:predicted  nucleic acid-binding Zn-ribbon protein
MADTKELTAEEKLKALYHLQTIDAKLDNFERLKGELPIEVSDLEDEVIGLQKRIEKLEADIATKNKKIDGHRNAMKDSETMRVRYEEQQMDVKNNREFEALGKEIELQKLEYQIGEKKIRECQIEIEERNKLIQETQGKIDERESELKEKKVELEKIIAETEKEEKKLQKESDKAKAKLESRLVTAYSRIRKNYRNGMAVVKVERSSCGGCFNEIPPQLQVEIAQRKKIIVCENCGRILVDTEIDSKEEKKTDK